MEEESEYSESSSSAGFASRCEPSSSSQRRSYHLGNRGDCLVRNVAVMGAWPYVEPAHVAKSR